MNIIDRLELEINRYEKSPMRIHPHAIKLCIDAKREIEALKETAETATCGFCEHPDVFRKGLCAICFEDHYS